MRAESSEVKTAYGSQEDEDAAMKSLATIELDDHHLKETVISHFVTKFEKLSEVIHQLISVHSYSEFIMHNLYDYRLSQ